MSKRVTPRRSERWRPPFLEDVVAFWLWLYDATDRAVEHWLTKPRIGDVKPCPTIATFKPRDHFRANGKAKRKLTLAEAQRNVEAYPDTRYYLCSVCHEYHTGHKPKKAA